LVPFLLFRIMNPTAKAYARALRRRRARHQQFRSCPPRHRSVSSGHTNRSRRRHHVRFRDIRSPVAGSLTRPLTQADLQRSPRGRGPGRVARSITSRFTPAAPLDPATQYTVTVSNDFRRMDGSSWSSHTAFAFPGSRTVATHRRTPPGRPTGTVPQNRMRNSKSSGATPWTSAR